MRASLCTPCPPRDVSGLLVGAKGGRRRKRHKSYVRFKRLSQYLANGHPSEPVLSGNLLWGGSSFQLKISSMGIGSLHTVLMFSPPWGWGACVWFLFKSGGVLLPLDGGIAAGERDQFREGALSASSLALAPIPGGGWESIEKCCREVPATNPLFPDAVAELSGTKTN